MARRSTMVICPSTVARGNCISCAIKAENGVVPAFNRLDDARSSQAAFDNPGTAPKEAKLRNCPAVGCVKTPVDSLPVG